MKISTIPFLLSLLVFAACSGNAEKQDKPTAVDIIDSTVEPVEVTAFRSEVKVLADSVAYCIQQAHQQLEAGEDAAAIQATWKPVFKRLENRIDARTKAFRKEARKLKMDKQEAQSLLKEVNGILKPLMRKYQGLKNKGVDLR